MYRIFLFLGTGYFLSLNNKLCSENGLVHQRNAIDDPVGGLIECKKAAEEITGSLSATLKQEVNRPKGCYYAKNMQKVYFNEDTTGSAGDNAYQICTPGGNEYNLIFIHIVLY